ncbi:MAG TPA: orotidine-5'-phosphate decarboxylase [Methanoregulaceae archaeon]|nr:orotidine-5'-phosphate decarboxylase [Methanoregulaceae archaeon]
MAQLILALDVMEKRSAIAIATACIPCIDAIKVGYPLVLSSGLGIADDLGQLDLPLIADFKVADIPNTNRLIAEQVFSSGYDAIICHGFPGRDSAMACIETAHEYGGECYVVAEMSHPGGTEFFHDGIPEEITRLAIDCDADGVIAPATRPERVAYLKNLAGDRKVYSPGIGAQGGEIEKVAAIADGIIIGRSIYESADPAAAARQYDWIRR